MDGYKVCTGTGSVDLTARGFEVLRELLARQNLLQMLNNIMKSCLGMKMSNQMVELYRGVM